jgi:DNA repair exonuclease SbcCD ATPase subunit
MGQYLDTRDLAKRLDELTDERDDLRDAINDAREELEQNEDADAREELQETLADAEKDLEEWTDENEEEFKELQDLDNELTLSDGETMIPEEDFTAYVEELCTDCGYISKDFPHWIKIDWEKTAGNVAQDYTEVDYQGTTYKVRYC